MKAFLDFPDMMIKLLCIRGLTRQEDIDRFFGAGIDDMYSPYLMKGMDRASDRLKEAIHKQEKIAIYGDYDVDGITSTSSLYLFLSELGADVSYYIPDRIEEGYGINNEALSYLKNQGAAVVVTVDTGITATEEARHAKSLGMDLIIYRPS